MKHTRLVTVIIVFLFFVSQVIGIVVTSNYVDYEKTKETGNFTWRPLPSIAGMELKRPETKPTISVLLISIIVVVGTVLLLLILRLKKPVLWRAWFFLAVVLCLYIAFAAFVSKIAAFVLALVLAVLKVFRPNLIVHNFTELFVYSGLAVIFIPVLNVLTAIVLLILISAYDAYAVWKSRHMIEMAKLQLKSGFFAGLLVPYKIVKGMPRKPVKARGVRTAILGGGDVAFPIIFTGTVIKMFGPYKAVVVSVFVTLALLLLLVLGERKRFYPAMPFLTLGCLAGYLVLLLF